MMMNENNFQGNFSKKEMRRHGKKGYDSSYSSRHFRQHEPCSSDTLEETSLQISNRTEVSTEENTLNQMVTSLETEKWTDEISTPSSLPKKSQTHKVSNRIKVSTKPFMSTQQLTEQDRLQHPPTSPSLSQEPLCSSHV